MPNHLTSRQIGRFTGIPERTLADWIAKGVIPKSHDMSVVVKGIIGWFKEKEERARGKSSEDDDLRAAKVRLTNLQADKVALEIKERELDLVSASEVEREWSNYIYACKSRLLSMPSKLAYQLAGIDSPSQVQAILQVAVDEALTELGNNEATF